MHSETGEVAEVYVLVLALAQRSDNLYRWKFYPKMFRPETRMLGVFVGWKDIQGLRLGMFGCLDSHSNADLGRS